MTEKTPAKPQSYAERLRQHTDNNPSYEVHDFVGKKGWDRAFIPRERCTLTDSGFLFLQE